MPIPTKPRFRGTVTYMPTHGGIGIPCPGAKLRIFDNDIDGRDLLGVITADNQGRFNKQATKSWQDIVVVNMPWPVGRQRMPDVTDIPVLMMEVKDPVTGKSISGPYPYITDHLDTAIVLPWVAPNTAPIIPTPEIMNINGTSINLLSPPEVIWETIKNLAEAGDQFSITLGPPIPSVHGIPFTGNELNFDKFRDLVCQLIGIDINSSILRPNPAVETLTAITLMFFILMVASPLALGLSVFMMVMAMAVMLALMLGYEIEVEMDTSTSSGPGEISVPLTGLKLRFTKP